MSSKIPEQEYAAYAFYPNPWWPPSSSNPFPPPFLSSTWITLLYDDSDDDDDEGEDDYSPIHEDDKWEDELALQVYPDGYRDPNVYCFEDTSFEDFDDYDFEDEEELGDPPYEFDVESGDEQLEEGVEEISEFQCPLCQECSPGVLCITLGCVLFAMGRTM
ncbi:hypothetical protein L218DRAFT_945411 [Marasmius fiardii PR-910]|nr:hypothetical protein L218DRAFT_945411 [Marasmius fiardii PR-910]